MRVFCRDKVKVPEIWASETATPKISDLNLVARFKMKNWWNAPTFLSLNLPLYIFTWKALVPIITYHYFAAIVGRVNIRETHCDIYTMRMECRYLHSITTTSAIEIFITFLREPYKGLVRLILWPNFTDARGLPGAGPGLVRSVVTLHPLLSALVGEPIQGRWANFYYKTRQFTYNSRKWTQQQLTRD